MAYWFPKATGFTMNETWGKRAFYLWIIGFLMAFLPLYALGFMGMTRRLSQDINPEFLPLYLSQQRVRLLSLWVLLVSSFKST